MKELISKIKRKWRKFRLQPIRVFCLHHVSDLFDANTMYEVDWMQTDAFQKEIRQLKAAGYSFITLEEAQSHIQHDMFRRHKYAVLTADDGWASIVNILPWLSEQNIPITLFINPAYLDGAHYRDRETEKYLTSEELYHLSEIYPLVTIGSHGWDHTDATQQTIEIFKSKSMQSIEVLKKLPNYVMYYAFPYGRYTEEQLQWIIELGYVPLLVSGDTNYIRKQTYIDREILGLRRKK